MIPRIILKGAKVGHSAGIEPIGEINNRLLSSRAGIIVKCFSYWTMDFRLLEGSLKVLNGVITVNNPN